ncbi:MAG: hypothetical protein LBF67_07615 [Prevotellaceae bacterium]|nr:hypothetical protein [Prevotellaceae bacterium]
MQHSFIPKMVNAATTSPFRAQRGTSHLAAAATTSSFRAQRGTSHPYHRCMVEMAGGSSTAHARASRAPLGMTGGGVIRATQGVALRC